MINQLKIKTYDYSTINYNSAVLNLLLGVTFFKNNKI